MYTMISAYSVFRRPRFWKNRKKGTSIPIGGRSRAARIPMNTTLSYGKRNRENPYPPSVPNTITNAVVTTAIMILLLVYASKLRFVHRSA